MRRFSILIAGLITLAVLVAGCGETSADDPKKVVIALFGAMEQNDQARLSHLLDMRELMKSTGEDYALTGGKPRVFSDPRELLDDLTNDGETKRRWFSMQRIVNKAEIIDETAFVEVTFVDKESSRGYRTKFGLRKSRGKWKIYSFKTLQATP